MKLSKSFFGGLVLEILFELGSPLNLALGESRIGEEPLEPRDQRGVSFCDTISLSKTSYRGSNNSFEDDSNSSDAGISSHDDEFDRLNRIRTMEDEDYDYKIKWFFDRIER